jgi:hypothetical protein
MVIEAGALQFVYDSTSEVADGAAPPPQ